jgi:hypothetical protein
MMTFSKAAVMLIGVLRDLVGIVGQAAPRSGLEPRELAALVRP